MHGKAIAGSYQRTAVAAPAKTMADLIAAGFINSDGAPIVSVRYARIQAEAQAIRYTLDGSTPTATAGHVLAAGAEKTFTARELRDLKAIEASAGAYANVTLFSA